MTFTTDQVTTGISSCSNTRAFGPDKLSIFHQRHLGFRGIKYLTALNDTVTSCRIPSIWTSSIVIPIPKPGKDCSLSTSYRPISLLCPAAKVMEALLLPTINSHLLPSADQHGFRLGHSPTSAFSSTTPSHPVEFRRFGSYPLSSQSRNQAMTAFSALLMGLSRSSVRQRKLWRHSYFQPSTATCFHLQTNTVSDSDTLPLLRVISRQVSTKGNLHIVQSVSLFT